MDGRNNVKWSNFHVTINFNKDDETLVPKIVEAVERVPDEPYVWTWLKHYVNRSKCDFDMDDQGLVELVRVRAGIEHNGTENRGVHVHMLIEVTHRTMVQVERQGFVDLFEEIVGEKPNVHCKFVKAEGEDRSFILHYITKEVPPPPQKRANKKLLQSFTVGQVVDAESGVL